MPRGRPKLKEEERRSEPVGVRLSKQLRALLEEARQKSGAQSLSQEIEQRLRRSFTVDDEIKKRFGGNGTALIMQLIVEGILLIEGTCRRGNPDAPHWFDDRFMFEHAKSMIETTLDQFKPTGRKVTPSSVNPLMAKNLGQYVGLHILSALEFARDAEVGGSVSPRIFSATLPLGRRLRPGITKKMEQIHKPIARAAEAWQREQEKRK